MDMRQVGLFFLAEERTFRNVAGPSSHRVKTFFPPGGAGCPSPSPDAVTAVPSALSLPTGLADHKLRSPCCPPAALTTGSFPTSS